MGETPVSPKRIPAIKSEIPLERPEGLYSQSGKLLFLSPPLDVVAALHKIDPRPRISYFQYRIPEQSDMPFSKENPPKNYKTPKDRRAMSSFQDNYFFGLDKAYRNGLPNFLFENNCVIQHVNEYLGNKYNGKDVAVRGTACAISKIAVGIGGKEISDPAMILREGIEREGQHAPMLGFDTSHPTIPYRSLQWLSQHPQELRERARADNRVEEALSIFPILLIYDRTKFEEGVTTLPTDPTKRAECILEAIVLDYPLSRTEFGSSG